MPTAPSAADVRARLDKQNEFTVYDLAIYDQKRIAEAAPVYIYNVSPIHRWERFQGQLGTVTIHARPSDRRVSQPTIIQGEIARRYDRGLRRKDWMIEPGYDVAEDIVGCSAEYPAESSNNNLTTCGVFITREPLFKLSKDEKEGILDRAATYLKKVSPEEKKRILQALTQKISGEMAEDAREEILLAAEAKLDAKLRALILEGDQFHTQGHGNWISDIHRLALKALNEINDTQEERPWAPIRAGKRKVACKWCGIMNNPGVALCQGCHNVIDKELYAQLKKEQGKD